jgi:hypothetical protein
MTGIHRTVIDKVRDLLSDDSGLSTPSPGEHEKGRTLMGNSLPLWRIECGIDGHEDRVLYRTSAKLKPWGNLAQGQTEYKVVSGVVIRSTTRDILSLTQKLGKANVPNSLWRYVERSLGPDRSEAKHHYRCAHRKSARLKAVVDLTRN